VTISHPPGGRLLLLSAGPAATCIVIRGSTIAHRACDITYNIHVTLK